MFADIMRKAAAGEFDVEGSTLTEVAESAAAQADSPHDELLEKYQVASDPDGITEWSPKWVGWLPGVPSMKVTASEAEMLNELQDRQGLKGVKAAYDIYKEALNQAENTFDGRGGTDGHADAFRHAYWNAMMTDRFGEEWTQEYATAHERNPDSHPTPVAMDLHNNEVGRRITVHILVGPATKERIERDVGRSVELSGSGVYDDTYMQDGNLLVFMKAGEIVRMISTGQLAVLPTGVFPPDTTLHSADGSIRIRNPDGSHPPQGTPWPVGDRQPR